MTSTVALKTHAAVRACYPNQIAENSYFEVSDVRQVSDGCRILPLTIHPAGRWTGTVCTVAHVAHSKVHSPGKEAKPGTERTKRISAPQLGHDGGDVSCCMRPAYGQAQQPQAAERGTTGYVSYMTELVRVPKDFGPSKCRYLGNPMKGGRPYDHAMFSNACPQCKYLQQLAATRGYGCESAHCMQCAPLRAPPMLVSMYILLGALVFVACFATYSGAS